MPSPRPSPAKSNEPGRRAKWKKGDKVERKDGGVIMHGMMTLRLGQRFAATANLPVRFGWGFQHGKTISTDE